MNTGVDSYLFHFGEGEAEHLKHLGMPGMARSTVASTTREIHESRTSFNAFLQRSQDKVVLCIEERASRLSQKPVENIEPLQVVYVLTIDYMN